MGASKPDAVLDAVLQLVNLEASWFPRGTFLEWAGDTWSPGGLPQVLVFTSLYFVMGERLAMSAPRSHLRLFVTVMGGAKPFLLFVAALMPRTHHERH